MRAIAIFLAATAFLLGACNTIEGAGKDIKAGGAKVQETAKDAKEKM
jgi:predicted small secreted protein